MEVVWEGERKGELVSVAEMQKLAPELDFTISAHGASQTTTIDSAADGSVLLTSSRLLCRVRRVDPSRCRAHLG